MKTLIIAEKPSVAADLARVLGRVPRKDDHFENDEYVITSALGHLVELQMPEDYDKRFRYWRLDDLPIIPDEFALKPIERSRRKFDEVKRLLGRKDVGAVVNACDAGREGELIFTYLYQLTASKKPVRRLWMSSMTPEGIREAFAHLREGAQMQNLAAAARCRSESDWVVGINCTRGATKRLFGSRAGNVASVGRVQTPTLAIVMERERQIRSFKPRTYWRVVGKFAVAEGAYDGVYQRDGFRKNDDEHDRADRVWEKPHAEQVAAALAPGARAQVTEEKKRTTQIAPRLYDLTTLQREANNRFGFSASRTLQIAQALYERHKVITYPRTDSRALPEDYMPVCRQVLQKLSHGHDLDEHAAAVLEHGWVRPDRRIFNNAQVSDHFAIIPTTELTKKLADDEAKIFDMISRRFVAAFFPVAEFDVTTRLSKVGAFTFKTEGKVLVTPGWLAVYGRAVANENGATLPPLTAADGTPARAQVTGHEIVEEQTKPPPRYTEATLLSAMEGAGKLVEDDELAEAMKEKGLGTPATRAQIIEKLLEDRYLVREHRELVPTGKAESLLDFLGAVGAEVLTRPDLTGEWEFKLRKMEHGQLPRETFMREIEDVTTGIVDRMKKFSPREQGARDLDWKSPTDGQPMRETVRSFESNDEKIRIYKITAGRRISEDEARLLVEKKEIGPFSDLRSPKTGKTYTAALRLERDEEKDGWKVRIALPQGEDAAALPVVWTDPKTGDELCEGSMEFVLRRPVPGAAPEVLFRMGRSICRKEVPREQVIKLLSEGRTDAIADFISKKGRKFTAILVRNGPKFTWEFPPREKAERKPGAKERKGRSPAAAPDLTHAQAIGKSAVHDGELLETPEAFFVRKPGANGGRVVFKMNRTICSREIPVDEVKQLLESGRTGLIGNFISKRGLPFEAYLVISDDKSRANFEFPPR